MAVLESCPKHNMVAYLEKTEGNAEFHEVIDFLARSSIHHALTVSPVVSTTFVEQFWMSAKSKIINNVNGTITDQVAGKLMGKVTPLFTSMLVQSIEDEGATSERPSEPQPTPSPPHPKVSGGNHGGQSSSDKSLSGNEGPSEDAQMLGRGQRDGVNAEKKDIPEAEKKFKQLARDEEIARKLQEDWETEEERKRKAEEEAIKIALSDEYDFI
ncbi:hypothetical protein Tco_0749595 [Tanacetum coccineum]|uniref:Uncharacterized protein n=1 Tax=Tanacetum coccineum TaxID=301880 RepID=A0ABQ4YYX9_9ASTR